MMRYFFLFILYFVVFAFQIKAQPNQDIGLTPEDHEKYVTHRKRLWDLFLREDKFGLVDLKNENADDELDHWCVPYSDVKTDVNGEIKLNSQSEPLVVNGEPGIKLGWYMAVLATEYRLLKDAGKDVEPVKRELYYAMRNYESMDRRAEFFYAFQDGAAPKDAKLNGVFTRIYDRNIPLPKGNGELEDPKNCYAFNSGDQMAGLLLGFAFVQKCLRTDEEYTGPDAGPVPFNYHRAATVYVHALGNMMKKTNYDIQIPNADNTDNINSSLGGSGDEIYGKHCGNFKMHGLSGEGNGKLFMEAAQKLTGDDYRPETCDLFGCHQNFTLMADLNLYSSLFNSIPSFDVYWSSEHEFAIGYKMTYSSIKNVIGNTFESAAGRYNIELFLAIHDYLNGFEYNAFREGRYKDYFLAKIANKNGVMYKPDDYPDAYTKYWNKHRYSKSSIGIRDKSDGKLTKTNFTGLDYMLLYNMYRLTYQKHLPETKTLSGYYLSKNVTFYERAQGWHNTLNAIGDISSIGGVFDDEGISEYLTNVYLENNDQGFDEDETPVTFHQEHIGLDDIPSDVVTTEEITSSETIDATGNRGYYSKKVILNPGFHAVSNSKFKAVATENEYGNIPNFVQHVPLQIDESQHYKNLDLPVELNVEKNSDPTANHLMGSGISVYPNPSVDQFFITGKDLEYVNQVIMKSSNGVQVLNLAKEQLDGRFYDIRSLPSGVYFLEFKTEGNAFTKKFIKI